MPNLIMTYVHATILKQQTFYHQFTATKKTAQFSPTLLKLIEHANNTRTGLLICSPMPTPLYGNPTTCNRGKKWEEELFNLNIHAIGKTPTFKTGRGQSIIDITITNQFFETIENWEVEPFLQNMKFETQLITEPVMKTQEYKKDQLANLQKITRSYINEKINQNNHTTIKQMKLTSLLTQYEMPWTMQLTNHVPYPKLTKTTLANGGPDHLTHLQKRARRLQRNVHISNQDALSIKKQKRHSKKK